MEHGAGSKMRKKGGQTLGKDGGAHGETHVSVVTDQITGEQLFAVDRHSNLLESKISGAVEQIQDGGSEDQESNVVSQSTMGNSIQINVPVETVACAPQIHEGSRIEIPRYAEIQNEHGEPVKVVITDVLDTDPTLSWVNPGTITHLSSPNKTPGTIVKDGIPVVLVEDMPTSQNTEISLPANQPLQGHVLKLIDTSGEDLNDFNFSTLTEDRSNTLMTPQELETMPERGLEFEESVGPRQPAVEDGGPTSDVPNETSLDDLQIGTSLLSLPSTSESGMNLNTADLSLATISVSTDKAANMTQIIINTNQGQQLFQINTSNIDQATSALQPIALTGNMELKGKTGSQTFLQSATVNSEGMLIIPVYNSIENENGATQEAVASGSSKKPSTAPSERHVANGTEYRLKCNVDGCGKMFQKLFKLKVHMMGHTGERPFKCDVPGCEWAFTTAYKLKRHKESHKKEKLYICPIKGCEKRFSTIYNLKAHAHLHKRPDTKVCSVEGCEAKFDTDRKLDVHMMKCHKDIGKKHKCPIEGCDRTFYSTSCMGSHMRVHREMRDLTCHFEGCGKTFDKLSRLQQHERMHTGEKPYVCPEEGCGWAFTSSSKLTRHQLKHSQNRKWVCEAPGCGKAFLRAEHLRSHFVSHTGEKPFSCPIEGCFSTFRAKSSLRMHVKKHSQPPKKIYFYCPLEGCDKRFTAKVALRRHLQGHYQTTETVDAECDITPFLADDLQDSSLEGFPQTQSAESKGETPGGSGVSSTAGVVLSSPEYALINPADYIAGDQPIVTVSNLSSDLITHVGNNVVTQLIVTDQMAQTRPGFGAAGDTAGRAKIAIATDVESSSRVLQENTSGSARTDYRCNHFLSDKAKRRRQLLRERSNIDMHDLKPQNLVTSISGPTINPHELLTSRAITFRDPETGTTYVQTQLLQDDPPNPELYSEENPSPLGSDLHDSVLQDNSDIDAAAVEFTGTQTINLQDLE